MEQCIGLIEHVNGKSFTKIMDELERWRKALNANHDVIQVASKKIISKITEIGRESIWLTQNTNSSDLRTTSSRHFTVDVGITNIGAYDNKNTYRNIQKLFFGANFYIKSIDKNANFRKIPVPPKPDDEATHYLESRNSILQRLSFTVGITLGAMKKKDFDNVYNNVSFTFGPSLRVGKYIKVSTGVAWLKRFDSDPLRANSNSIVGEYVSLSLDYDLLSALSNVTSLIFR